MSELDFKKAYPHNLSEAANRAASYLYANTMIVTGHDVFPAGKTQMAGIVAGKFNEDDFEVLNKKGLPGVVVVQILSLSQAYAQTGNVSHLKGIHGCVRRLKQLGWKSLEGEPRNHIPHVGAPVL